MPQSAARAALSTLTRVVAVASLLLMGKSQAWAVHHAEPMDVSDPDAATDELDAGSIQYVETGDAEGEDDDNPPKPE